MGLSEMIWRLFSAGGVRVGFMISLGWLRVSGWFRVGLE